MVSERKLAFEFIPDDGKEMEQSRQENISEFAGKDDSVLFGQVQTKWKKKSKNRNKHSTQKQSHLEMIDPIAVDVSWNGYVKRPRYAKSQSHSLTVGYDIIC